VACERLELNLRQSTQRPRRFQPEILGARTLIRSKGFLAKPLHALTTINDEGVNLDPSFLKYVILSESNRQMYYESYLKGDKTRLPLINSGTEVTLNSNDIELKDAIQRKLAMLREPFYSFYKKSYKKSMPKSDLESFYRALVAQLHNQDDVEYELLLSEAINDFVELQT